MKKIAHSYPLSLLVLPVLAGCTIKNTISSDSMNKMGAGAPQVNENGEFADSSFNRRFFEERARRDIAAEKSGNYPEYDWKRAWRVSFESFKRGQENPTYKKNLVIKLRKEAGLPIWPFMLE